MAVNLIEHHSAAELFSRFFNGKYGRELLFRGQGDADFSLTPGIARGKASYENWSGEVRTVNEDGTQSVYHEDGYRIARYEYRLIRDFIKACDRAGVTVPGDGVELRRSLQLNDERLPIPFGMNFDENDFGLRKDKDPPFSWPSSNDYQAIILAQHHGLETRLLDWTKSACVAMYFSCVNAMNYLLNNVDAVKGKKLTVWVVSGRRLNDSQKSPFYALESPASLSVNINPQQGCFTTFRGNGFSSKEGYELDRCVNSSCFIEKHDLDIKEAASLYLLCLQNGYTGASLFPGPEGAAKEADERAMLRILKENGF